MNIQDRLLNYVRDWESKCYLNGLPDDAPAEIFDMVPNYRRIALAILRNDNTLKSLGFTPPKSKYYSQLKRIEISKRAGVQQLSLF